MSEQKNGALTLNFICMFSGILKLCKNSYEFVSKSKQIIKQPHLERERQREKHRERGAYTPFRGTQLHSQFEREREREREREKDGVTSYC